jgi:uncharacterized protein YgiM (DUF1202 family)
MKAEEMRRRAVAAAKSRAGLNRYTQGAKRAYVGGYPEAKEGAKGYSDCSSFVRWVLKTAAGIDIGANTDQQIRNRGKGVLIEMAAARQTAPTEALLLPGDCLYWKGTPSHAWGVGHVEMYIGGGKCIGHGSGTGPTVKTLKTYSRGRGAGDRKYLCAIRWIMEDAPCALGDRLLRFGDVGPDVMALQRLLRSLGYDLGAWGPLRDGCDGEFGSDTRRAVRAFEAAHGLAPDGVADAADIRAICLAAGAPLGSVRVTATKLNVRRGPGTENGVVGVAAKGDVLALTGDDTEAWRGVFYRDARAYVSAKYVEAV